MEFPPSGDFPPSVAGGRVLKQELRTAKNVHYTLLDAEIYTPQNFAKLWLAM